MPPATLRKLAFLLILLAPCALFALASLARGGVLGLPLDDAWIHAAYAQSFAAGHPLQLHPASPVSPGSSAPLWTILLALPHLLLSSCDPHSRAVVAAFLIGLICAAGAMLAFWALLREVGLGRGGALAGVALLACQGRWIWGVLSGLEVPLYTALLIAALFLHIRAKGRGRWSLWALPLAALSGWARPECFVLPFLLALDSLLLPPRGKGALPRRPARPLALFLAAALIAAYLGAHLGLYGRPFPTTFYVKAEQGSALSSLAAGAPLAALLKALSGAGHQLLADLAFFPAQIFFLLPFAGIGALHLLHRPARAASILLVVVLLFPPLQGAVSFVQPENQVGRYFWHQVPPWLLLALVGVQVYLHTASGEGHVMARWLGAGALVAIAAIASSALLSGFGPRALGDTALYVYLGFLDFGAARLSASLEFYRATSAVLALWHVVLLLLGPLLLVAIARLRARLVAVSLGAGALALLQIAALATIGGVYARNVDETERISVAAGRWVAVHTDPSDLIACHDLGAMAYFGSRRLLDLQGIGSPQVLALPRGAGGRRDLAPLLLRERPRFYVGFLEWHLGDLIRTAVAWRDLPAPGHEAAFCERYTWAHFSLAGGITLGGEDMRVFEIPWRSRAQSESTK